MTQLIPTKHKSKLPHTHSYPIGAEAISTALQSTPQIEKLSLSFSGFHMVIHPLLKEIPCAVIQASYRNLDVRLSNSNAFIKEGWCEEQWELTVYAVLRTQRARLNELLLAEGLSRIAQWLATPRDDVWLYGQKSYEVLYSRLDDALVIKEN